MKKQTINLRALVRTSESFQVAIHQLRRDAGLSTGRAILIAKRHDPAGFGAWMKRRWNQSRGGAVLQEL